jgi:phosphoribosylformylglycinamidine cyclo-ligase
MPGIYQAGDYDLAGCIVGVVERRKIIDGSGVRPGDVIIGLPGDGLHTNGYSLARHILFTTMGLGPQSRLPGLRRSLGEELLRVHPNYQPKLAALPAGRIKGAAHITGGGLLDNLPRVLPPDCDAVIDTARWKVPPIFGILQTGGRVPREEMFQVFNMGIGIALIVAEKHARETLRALPRSRLIGDIRPGSGQTQIV